MCCIRCAVAALLLLWPAAATIAQTDASIRTKKPESGDVGVVYVPTPHDIVAKMLSLAAVKKSDVVYDLGCGDGRIVVTAAKKFGCRAAGFDIDPERIKEARANVKKNNVGDLVKIQQEDVFKLDLAPASVITLYLLPSLNVKLIPQLEKLAPGARIVSHDFDMAGVTPDKKITIVSKEDNVEHTLYLWTIPLKRETPKPKSTREF